MHKSLKVKSSLFFKNFVSFVSLWLIIYFNIANTKPTVDIKQITNSLNDIFDKENYRIVFWHDPEQEFSDILGYLDLQDVTVLRKDHFGTLELKIKLEIEEINGRYLIYCPFAEPDIENDWFADIKLYSKIFIADSGSIILNELNLSNHSLRSYLNSRKKFLANQKRLEKLKRVTTIDDNEDSLDLKMMTVLVNAEQVDLFTVLMRLFGSFCDEKNFNTGKISKIWEEFDKFELVKPFWKFVNETFGYEVENPAIPDLLRKLLVTDMASKPEINIPSALNHFVIMESSQTRNIPVFLAQWRNNISNLSSYSIISKHFEAELNITDNITGCDIEQLLDVMTFECVERWIIPIIRDMLINDKECDLDEIKEFIQYRRNGYWATNMRGNNKEINHYKITYDALETAIEMFTLRNKYCNGLSYATAELMFNAYTEELFRFDQMYRHFMTDADDVESAGWDVLKTLRDLIEDCYAGWFLEQSGIVWDGLIDGGKESGLLNNWRLPKVKNQYRFYNDYVKIYLESNPKNRVFVIISDAFRYEAAEEMTAELNGKYRFKATLEPMLGVLPSYTALGMAALLPHKTIEYKDNANPEIVVNSKPSGSLKQRAAILKPYQGVAIKADDLTSMKRDEGREFVKPYRVIYVYHNRIDSTGDKAETESDVFSEVKKSIEDLNNIVNIIINRLNGSYVLVTADHGFVYHERSPEAINKSALGKKSSDAVEAKKRYIIKEKLGKSKKTLCGNTKETAQTEQVMEFWLPHGINRFHFVGGARYFHGGAMLQEIVVPVIKIKEARGKELEKTAITKVGVSLLGSSKKIVTNLHRFEFIQTEAVSERVKLRILNISIRDGENIVSNEETVAFDSSSASMDERKKSVKLMLKANQYDNKKEYYLVLRDADSEVEYGRIPVYIDLAFINDF